ncbi:hypothetical protein IWW36_000816 [Coemansia brasiliensis]|uniref:Enhancer of mRNA-decapping protein 4 WD40 repeat region domain-containing protein n=1 Tax=Coemansia brasiliensis TaxID=2650707 RepID=A0A9W8M2M6_9FUNG|nr:hypothetical protein IWW36_000816 [Coemansia brasiliensis]
MDNSNPHTNPLFSSSMPAEQFGRRLSDQKSASSQTPSMYGDSWDAGRVMGFGSPALSSSAMQPNMAASTQQPQKEVSLSLLQALLKPQPAQSFPSSHTSMQVSDSESAVGQSPDAAFLQQQQQQIGSSNPIEQLKRMMAAQNAVAGSGSPQSTFLPQQASQAGQMAPKPSVVPQAPAQTKPLSAHSSPRINAIPSIPSTPPMSAQTTPSVSGTPAKKRTKSAVLNIDLRRIKLKNKPETVPISLLQQPTRFRPGRLIAVSREYICYAVRSKEGGHVRVIHQLQGQLAKMQGHKDSIVDMEFHPCSRDANMPQVLASLGKENRLIIWLVGPVDKDAAGGGAEGTIAYEPFINIDSGGDARFTCLAWRREIVDNTMELCVGTDKGFMAVKAPVPSPKGKRSETSNEGLNVIPIGTESAVTAIARAGLHWVIVASADKKVRIYQLDSRWENANQPHAVVCELPQGEHSIDTIIYIPPATTADGAGHIILGCSMNRQVQLWWLGTSAQQVALVQTVSFAGPAAKSASSFVKLTWAEQGRCLTVGASQAPSAIFVLQSSGHGAGMRLNMPLGYSLGDEQTILSMVSTLEPQAASYGSQDMLSIYSVHTRLVQQLQIPDIPAANIQSVSDPAEIYSTSSTSVATLQDGEIVSEVTAPAPKQQMAPSNVETATSTALHSTSTVPPAVVNGTAELASKVQKSVLAQLQPQIAAALSGLDLSSKNATIKLDAAAEEQLVARISSSVEKRVAESVAAAMERTLIPAYTRATAAMFEQMQTTFEAGLREWWTRFAQTMPPPPPPPPQAISTPHSQMVMMPQMSSGSAAPEHSAGMTHHMSAPQFTPGMPPPPGPASGTNHIESLMSILNFQNAQKPQ